MLAALDSPNRGAWLDADRESLARMRNLSQANAPPAPPPPIEDLPELTEAERPLYRQMIQAQRDGALSRAWEIGQPLFKAHPTVYKLQDARCTLAMNLVGWFAAKAECEPLMKMGRKH